MSDQPTHKDLLIEITKFGVVQDMHTTAIKEHSDSIRQLELFKAKLVGYAMAGAAAGSFVVEFLAKVIK